MFFFNHPIILFNVSEKLPYKFIPIRGKEKKTTMTKMSLTNTMNTARKTVPQVKALDTKPCDKSLIAQNNMVRENQLPRIVP